MYQQLLKQDFYKKISLDLPSLSELNLRDIQIETQERYLSNTNSIG